jgi:hypothetical protein
MKTWHAGMLILALLAATLASAAQDQKEPVPRYDKSQEQTFKGVVDDVRDRECPVSGGLGSHIMFKLNGGTVLEVHLAKTKFVKDYDLTFKKGDQLEIIGVKVKFEGVDTIFAREIKSGGDLYMFRDKDGKPIW